MKKLFLFIYFASIITFIGYSQSLSLLDTLGNPLANNSNFTKSGTPSDDEMVALVYVKNNTQQPLSVKVKKVELSLVDGTINMFCWGLCFAPQVYVSPDSIMIDGDSVNRTDFSGHYIPSSYKGVSVIRYVFFNTANTNDSVCVNISYSAFPLGISNAQGSAVLSNAYPNPANSNVSFNFNVTGSENNSIVIRNILGSVVSAMTLSGNSGKITIDTGDLAEGVYFCSLLINGESTITRKLIIKH